MADLGDWQPAEPRDAASWLAGVSAPWWIAGGWAIDSFLGRTSRPHADLDVGLLRRDFVAVRAALTDWEIYEAKDGTLALVARDVAPRAGVSSLWCRRAGSSRWMLEIMLDDSAGDCWIYRREPRVFRPIAEIVLRGGDGIPYLAPELQLLYKARGTRPKDEADFANALPLLDDRARAWLKGALLRTQPSHAWLRRLE
jgi:hypothetical protein